MPEDEERDDEDEEVHGNVESQLHIIERRPVKARGPRDVGCP